MSFFLWYNIPLRKLASPIRYSSRTHPIITSTQRLLPLPPSINSTPFQTNNKHTHLITTPLFVLLSFNPLRKVLQLRVLLLIRHACVVIRATVPEATSHTPFPPLQSSNHTSCEVPSIHPLNALHLVSPPNLHIIRSCRCFELHYHDSVRIRVEDRNLLNVSKLLAAAFHVLVKLRFEVRLYHSCHIQCANAWFLRGKTCFEGRWCEDPRDLCPLSHRPNSAAASAAAWTSNEVALSSRLLPPGCWTSHYDEKNKYTTWSCSLSFLSNTASLTRMFSLSLQVTSCHCLHP